MCDLSYSCYLEHPALDIPHHMNIPVFRIAAKDGNLHKPRRTKQPKFFPQEMWMILDTGGLENIAKILK